MTNISGEKNEKSFVKYLNGKTVSQLNPLFRDLIYELFPNESMTSNIKCWKNYCKEKSDIFIQINNTVKGISIKKVLKTQFM